MFASLHIGPSHLIQYVYEAHTIDTTPCVIEVYLVFSSLALMSLYSDECFVHS